MKLVQELIILGQQLAEEKKAASDLWSLLPSHATAMKNHGDHAHVHCPTNQDVMLEAALYLAHLLRPVEPLPLTVNQQTWFTRCPCGADHLGDTP